MEQATGVKNSELPSTKWIQVSVWALFLLFLCLYTIQKWDNILFGIYNSSIAAVSYLIAVYVNAYWLLPKYYKQRKKYHYYIYSAIFLSLLVALRMFAEYKLLFPLHTVFYNFTLSHFAFDIITILVAFAFGTLLYISLNYISLLQKQEALKRQQTVAQLDLLKAQVQPHFLFNTLNNIYYLAYTKSDKTAEVVAKLSDIMRYFVDEVTRDKVALQTELNFINNYIELEQIRMLHPIKIEKDFRVNESVQVPPMLLINLVENIFKHGIDKMNMFNYAHISLIETDAYLVLKTVNNLGGKNAEAGKGLDNLRKRLTLLFNNDFALHTEQGNQQFTAELKFPIK